jgi:hypothetical protein
MCLRKFKCSGLHYIYVLYLQLDIRESADFPSIFILIRILTRLITVCPSELIIDNAAPMYFCRSCDSAVRIVASYWLDGRG